MREFIEYGKWARHNPDRLSYPSPWLEMVMRDNVPSPPISYTITDDRAVAIDKAVCALARYSVLQYQIFCLRYLVGLSEWQIANILKIKRNQTRSDLHKADGFICGVLEKNA